MDNLTDKIYQLSLDSSWLDDEFGDVESVYGWNGLIKGKRYIFAIAQDNQGFKYIRYALYKVNGLKHMHGAILELDWNTTKEFYYKDLEKESI